MIDISVTDLVKSFDLEKKILDGVSFQIDTGERVGLLGKNGAGKSTLFNILTGELDYDSGQVLIAPGRRVGLISQIPVYPEGYTVEDVLRSAFQRTTALKEEMDRLTRQMEQGDSDPQTLRRYGELTARFEGLGGYDTDTAVNKVSNGLSIDGDMRQRLFDQLSGGEKTRVNLGRLILEDTDILLLDEPTNHLDLQATEWLEEYIRSFRGTVVTISHDRYFLDRTVTRIIEILDGKAEFYSGNYSFYAIEKERRYQERMKQYLKEQAKIQQLEKAAEQMHLWAFMGNDALHKRAFSMEKRIERMRTVSKPTRAKKMDARFASREFRGDEVLQIRDLSKGFDGRMLFSGVYLRVEGGERIALIGENGTGKEMLAQEIHRLSTRKEHSMVTVDMGAISESLFESELFGHERGSFTDAYESRPGKFEAASGSSLFMDEIGNLPLAMQAKLLTVLQNRKITRIGSNKVIPVDIRLLSATNKNIQGMVDSGTFREDLLYRLNTIHLEIPPLRERREDIHLFIDYFMQRYAAKYEKKEIFLHEHALEKLCSYHWPGNIRELQHTIEKAVILCEGDVIRSKDIFVKQTWSPQFSTTVPNLEEVERQAIETAIRQNDGNLTATAEQLGISRQTLYNKIKRFKL